MQRRDFFKFGALSCAAALTPSAVFAAQMASEAKKTRTFEVTLNHVIKGGKNTRLWVPLVKNTDFQHLVRDYAIGTNAGLKYISDTEIPTLYAEFDGKEDAKMRVLFKVETTERNTDFSKVNFDENEKLAPEIAQYITPTAQIPNTGIVKQRAEEIVGKTKGDLEKARKIYLWVANTMERDNSIPGCGTGDVKAILESGKLVGKCTDINSVFVGLCRAVGIPAREMFGIRVGQSRFSNQMGSAKDGVAAISGGQHCRAEFYLKGYGWIPVDPADVAKVRLGEKLTNDDAKIIAVRDYLFGNWEMCWVGFNYGRDFVLKPEPEQYPINNFGYPYAEVAGDVLDYYDPKGFYYDYKSIEL